MNHIAHTNIPDSRLAPLCPSHEIWLPFEKEDYKLRTTEVINEKKHLETQQRQ